MVSTFPTFGQLLFWFTKHFDVLFCCTSNLPFLTCQSYSLTLLPPCSLPSQRRHQPHRRRRLGKAPAGRVFPIKVFLFRYISTTSTAHWRWEDGSLSLVILQFECPFAGTHYSNAVLCQFCMFCMFRICLNIDGIVGLINCVHRLPNRIILLLID